MFMRLFLRGKVGTALILRSPYWRSWQGLDFKNRALFLLDYCPRVRFSTSLVSKKILDCTHTHRARSQGLVCVISSKGARDLRRPRWRERFSRGHFSAESRDVLIWGETVHRLSFAGRSAARRRGSSQYCPPLIYLEQTFLKFVMPLVSL